MDQVPSFIFHSLIRRQFLPVPCISGYVDCELFSYISSPDFSIGYRTFCVSLQVWLRIHSYWEERAIQRSAPCEWARGDLLVPAAMLHHKSIVLSELLCMAHLLYILSLLYCNCLFVVVLLGAVGKFQVVASDHRVWLLGLSIHTSLWKVTVPIKGYNSVLLWFYLFAVVILLLSSTRNASDSRSEP